MQNMCLGIPSDLDSRQIITDIFIEYTNIVTLAVNRKLGEKHKEEGEM